eukprot:g2691.t1
MPKYDPLGHARRMKSVRISDVFSVKSKVVLVTGGSRGIGLMIARAFVQNGAKVYIVSRKKKACDSVAEYLNSVSERGGSAVSLPANLSSDEGCRNMVREFEKIEPTKKVDVLVNNAGVTWGDSFDDFPEKAWSRTMTLNVASVFNLTRACLPLLRAASRGNLDPSHVINISSIAGNPTFSHYGDNAPSYAASKAACNKVTQYLAAYLKDDGICVNAIAPAVFPSKMTYDYQLSDASRAEFTNQMHPVGRIGNEIDMAGTVLFLASKASAFITGSVINLDGGSVAIRASL